MSPSVPSAALNRYWASNKIKDSKETFVSSSYLTSTSLLTRYLTVGLYLFLDILCITTGNNLLLRGHDLWCPFSFYYYVNMNTFHDAPVDNLSEYLHYGFKKPNLQVLKEWNYLSGPWLSPTLNSYPILKLLCPTLRNRVCTWQAKDPEISKDQVDIFHIILD